MITSTCMAKSVVTQPTLTSAESPQLPASIWTCFMLLGVIQPPPSSSSSSSSSASSSLLCSPSSSCWSPLMPSCSSAAQLSADRSTDSNLFVTVMASTAYREGKKRRKILKFKICNFVTQDLWQWFRCCLFPNQHFQKISLNAGQRTPPKLKAVEL